MKKKLLSLLLAGMVFLSMGLSADCLAAPHHTDNGRSAQHRMFKPHSHGPQKVKKHKKTKHKTAAFCSIFNLSQLTYQG